MDTHLYLIIAVLIVSAVPLAAILLASRDIKKEGFGQYVKRGGTYHGKGGAKKSWEDFFNEKLKQEEEKYRGEEGIKVIARKLEEWKKSREDEGLRGDGYVWERIETICTAMDPRHRDRRLPLLGELRGLSLQREQSGFYACVFRAMIPSILVMGIACTLFGVHSALPQVSQSNQLGGQLGNALLPGAFAVLCTIVLFIFRGMYNRALSRLIADLDDLTMETLFPYFQEVETHFRLLTQFVDNIQSAMSQGEESGGVLHERMAQFAQMVAKWKKSSELGSSTLAEHAAQTDELRSGMISILTKEKDLADWMNHELSGLQKELEARAQHVEKIQASESSDKIESDLEKLRDICDRQALSTLECHERSRDIKDVLGKREEIKTQWKQLLEMGQTYERILTWLQTMQNEWKLKSLVNMQDSAKATLQYLPSKDNQGYDAQILGWLSEVHNYILENDSNVRTFIGERMEESRRYRNKLDSVKNDFLNQIPVNLYPPGVKGVYMKVVDFCCRIMSKLSS